jgi:hypothetical protein
MAGINGGFLYPRKGTQILGVLQERLVLNKDSAELSQHSYAPTAMTLHCRPSLLLP